MESIVIRWGYAAVFYEGEEQMAVPPNISPTYIDFGRVVPLSSGPPSVLLKEFEQPNAPVFDGGFVIESAPADADVTVWLSDDGDPPGAFEIVALNTYDPRPGPAPGQTFYDLVISSDGSSAVSVRAGQLVFIGAIYNAPLEGDEFWADIFVRGTTWGYRKRLFLHFSLQPVVETSLHTVTPVVLPRGQRVNVLVAATALSGAETDVVYAPAPVSSQPEGVSVPGLVLHLPTAPSVTYGYLLLDVAANAWLGDDELVIEQRVGVAEPTNVHIPVTVVEEDPARWQFVGPLSSNTGRATSVAFDPQQPSTWYLGADGGGVWRTGDSGQTWEPVTDWWTYKPFTVGSIAVDPLAPDMVYVGTTAGLMRTLDAGRTWSAIGEEFRGANITKVLIDSPDYVWVTACPGGVWRSSDDGDSWQPMAHLNDNACWTDIARATGGRPRYYVVAAGDPQLWRTDDGGGSWTRLLVGAAARQRSFLPRQYGKPLLACSPADPDVVYLYCPLAQTKDGDPQGSIYQSSDAGATWSDISAGWPDWGDLHSVCFACSFDGPLGVGSDDDVLYIGKANLWRLAQGRWHQVPDLHPDEQAVAISPSDPNQVLIANDGGVFLYDNANVTTASKNSQLGGLTQLYSVGYSEADQVYIIGGAQDVGTMAAHATDSAPQPTNPWSQVEWQEVLTGDGGSSAVNPTHPNIQFGTIIGYRDHRMNGLYRTADFWRTTSTLILPFDELSGEQHGLTSPFVFDHSDPMILYFATNFLYRWRDPYPADVAWASSEKYQARFGGAQHWERLGGGQALSSAGIRAIAVAKGPGGQTYIYTGAGDGQLWMSTNSGQSFRRIDNGLPGGPINSIAVDPHNPTDILIAVANKVYWCPDTSASRTTIRQFGDTFVWEDVSARAPSRFSAPVKGAGDGTALPNSSMNAIARDPLNPRMRWWVGTGEAVFHTEDGGVNWYNFPLGLPPIPIQQLTLTPISRYLYAATFGRGIWRARV
jgi:photosystem II stability/assembly factor-like uncharacterized protein